MPLHPRCPAPNAAFQPDCVFRSLVFGTGVVQHCTAGEREGGCVGRSRWCESEIEALEVGRMPGVEESGGVGECGAVVLWCCGAVVLWCCGAVGECGSCGFRSSISLGSRAL